MSYLSMQPFHSFELSSSSCAFPVGFAMHLLIVQPPQAKLHVYTLECFETEISLSARFTKSNEIWPQAFFFSLRLIHS